MLEFINETEYKDITGATSVPNNFDQLNIEASAYIDRQTFNRVNPSDIPEEVKQCTCYLIDLLVEEEDAIKDVSKIKSENVDGWSRTYATSDEVKKTYNNKKQDLLELYLSKVFGYDGNLLLYRGA